MEKSRRRKPWQLGVGIGIAAAAAAAAIVVLYPKASLQSPQKPQDVRVKGDGPAVAEVYVSKNGEVSQYDAKVNYESGTRFRVLVHASEPSEAFATVAVKGGQILAGGSELVQSKVSVAAGDDTFFPGSLELTGANDRESLVVMMCPKAAVDQLAPDGLRMALLALAKGEKVQGALEPCKRQEFSLRR